MNEIKEFCRTRKIEKLFKLNPEIQYKLFQRSQEVLEQQDPTQQLQFAQQVMDSVKQFSRFRAMSIPELEDFIKINSEYYYNNTGVCVDDATFDEAFSELKRRNPENVLLKRIGQDVGDFPKDEHLMKLYSQDKAENEDELIKWFQKGYSEFYLVEHKFNGLSLELQYEKGNLTKAITRGNGLVGDSLPISNAIMMGGILRRIPVDFTGAIRGEVILQKDVFEKKYKENRHCLSMSIGIIKRKN